MVNSRIIYLVENALSLSCTPRERELRTFIQYFQVFTAKLHFFTEIYETLISTVQNLLKLLATFLVPSDERFEKYNFFLIYNFLNLCIFIIF